MGVSSLLIELCESPYISSISSKCFRAGLVGDKLLIANFVAGYQQLSADDRSLNGLKAFLITIATTSMTCR
jgi:hypothetical protein